MTNLETNQLFDSIQRDIDEKLEALLAKIEKSKRKLTDSSKKAGFLDKMFINRDIKSYFEKKQQLEELNKLFSSIRQADSEKYVLPEGLKVYFDKLGTLLSTQEINQMQNIIKGILGEVNKEKKELIKRDVLLVEKILKDLDMGGKTFLIYNSSGQFMGETKSFINSLKEIERFQIEALTPEFYFVNHEPVISNLEIKDEMFLTNLEALIDSNSLEMNDNLKMVINNFNSIKKAFYNKNRFEEIILTLSASIMELDKIVEIDFTTLKEFLIQLENNYRKELQKVTEFLSTFDLERLEIEIEKNRTQAKEYPLETTNIMSNSEDTLTLEEQPEDEVMNELRAYAIRELELSGQFDINLASNDREAIINKKMIDLKIFSSMTPEQRGLEEYKKLGLVSPEATIEELTIQQLNDIRIGYRDELYDFVPAFKNWNSNQHSTAKANNIYREYIKYRFALKDKSDFLSFSQFAQQLYNAENMSETLVDEALVDEMKGMRK